jgi:hypothetical protein
MAEIEMAVYQDIHGTEYKLMFQFDQYGSWLRFLRFNREKGRWDEEDNLSGHEMIERWIGWMTGEAEYEEYLSLRKEEEK